MKNIFFLLLIFSFNLVHGQQPQTISKGFVFDDKNKNGILDTGEKGIADAVVCNQNTCVKTDNKGFYTLPVTSGNFIYVVKPSNYSFPQDSFKMPVFSYYYNPRGIPINLGNKVSPSTGVLPAQINFALYEREAKNTFKAIIIGDPQMRYDKQLGYFRDELVNDMLEYDNSAEFALFMGDIADDSLDIYPSFRNVLKPLNMNKLMVFGNHDKNNLSPNDTYKAETFRYFLGPDNYSFNQGEVHFIVFNNIKYNGWDKEQGKPGKYFGGINDSQLQWIASDLSFVPENHLVVLAGHIPVFEDYFDKADISKLFKVLGQRTKLLSLAGHLHNTERYNLDPSRGWNYKGVFDYINPGAACGSFWSSPKDERGIPASTCMDGSPNGFTIFTFTDNQYSFDFHAAGMGLGHELRISSPSGIVYADSAANNSIIVNVFLGNDKTQVTYTIDGKEAVALSSWLGKDPFIENNHTRRINDDNWLPAIVISKHLWKAPLPANLSKGTHRIKVVAVRDGKTFISEKIFDVR